MERTYRLIVIWRMTGIRTCRAEDRTNPGKGRDRAKDEGKTESNAEC